MQNNSPRRNHRGLCTYEGNKMWNYEILGTDIYHLLAAFVLYSILAASDFFLRFTLGFS